MSVVVHLLRHGRVDSHRGDVPLSANANVEIERAADRLAPLVGEGGRVEFLSTATRRTRDTAEGLRGLLAMTAGQAELVPARPEWAIRNPDVLLAGHRVEMVSSAKAYVDQLPAGLLSEPDVERVGFFREFISAPDRIGFWLNHAEPPGEDGRAVARRIMAFCRSLADRPESDGTRYVCVTHSPVLRAFVTAYLLDADPGEPEYVEAIDVTVGERETTVGFRDRTASVPHRT